MTLLLGKIVNGSTSAILDSENCQLLVQLTGNLELIADEITSFKILQTAVEESC